MGKVAILIVVILLGILLWLIGSVLYYIALMEEIGEELEDLMR